MSVVANDKQLIRSQVMAWPNAKSEHAEGIFSFPEKKLPLWVIGWTDQSNQVDLIVCGGIFCLPEVAGKSTDAVLNFSMEHEHNLIDIAIQKLKDDHKPCCETMCDPCFCPVCVCYENLCILGFWDARGEKNDRGENEDSSLLTWTNGLLRRFHPTDQGIWFTIAGQETANTNRSNLGCPQQLLLFDPFHDDQGSYYSIPAGFGKEELANSVNARMMLRLGHSGDVLQSLSIKVKELRSNATPQRKCNPDRDNNSVKKDKPGSEEATEMPS